MEDTAVILDAVKGVKAGVETMKAEQDGLAKRILGLEEGVKKFESYGSEGEAIKALKEEIATIKSFAISSQGITEQNLVKEKCAWFSKFFRANYQKDAQALRDLQKGTYSQNETSGTGSGEFGYMIPTEMAEAILNFDVKMTNSLVPYVSVMPMNKHSINVNEYVNGILAGKIGPHSTISDYAPSAKQHTLTAEKIAAMVFYDLELLQDVTPKLLQMIEEDARAAFDYRENWMILKADGTDDFSDGGVTGILSASGTNTVTLASSSIDTLDADDLADMIDAISIPIGQGMFVFHRSMRPLIRKMKDGSGRYIYDPAGKGGGETIWGEPVLFLTSPSPYVLPLYADAAAATTMGVYGDFKKGVLKGDRLSLEIAIDNSVAFSTYQSAVRWVKRMDYLTFGSCFTLLKTHA